MSRNEDSVIVLVVSESDFRKLRSLNSPCLLGTFIALIEHYETSKWPSNMDLGRINRTAIRFSV